MEISKQIIIAGPCAIEEKQQFLKTIEDIYKYVDIIRCGVWKARTSPKDYAGKGVEALKWIQNSQKKLIKRGEKNYSYKLYL